MTRSTDIDLTAIMEREGIRKIERLLVGKCVVLLDDGRLGIGATVGEALAKAKAPDAENILRLAA